MKNYYYLLVFKNGEKVPVKTKITIRSVESARKMFGRDDLVLVLVSDLMHYLIWQNS